MKKLFRLYRAPQWNKPDITKNPIPEEAIEPKPGSALWAAHLGDYEVYADAKAVALSPLADNVSYWIEPVQFNGDLENPEYTNDGPIEKVK